MLHWKPPAAFSVWGFALYGSTLAARRGVIANFRYTFCPWPQKNLPSALRRAVQKRAVSPGYDDLSHVSVRFGQGWFLLT